MDIHLTGMFKPCQDCAFGKAKKSRVGKRDAEHSNILGEKPFFDMSSHSTVTFRGKEHCLFGVKDNTDHAWSYLLKESPN